VRYGTLRLGSVHVYTSEIMHTVPCLATSVNAVIVQMIDHHDKEMCQIYMTQCMEHTWPTTVLAVFVATAYLSS